MTIHKMDKNNITKAMKLYATGKLSMGKSAELADVSIWKFLDLMKERKIPIKYDLKDIKKEIESTIIAEVNN